MQVTKRSGRLEKVDFNKILRRLASLSTGLAVDYTLVAQKTVAGITDRIDVRHLDTLAGAISAALCASHTDYSRLAGRIVVSDLQKSAPATFSGCVSRLHSLSRIAGNLHTFVLEHKEELDSIAEASRSRELDAYDFFSISTLKASYLLRDNQGDVLERPSYMWMRVACAVFLDDIAGAKECYHLLSNHYYTHASPTLFNAGLRRGAQLASCFLTQVESDSISGIFKTVGDCAQISKGAGGIGVSVSNVRAKDSEIGCAGGRSNGLVPMLKVFDSVARYVDQGGGKRKGAIAAYLEPWHADVEDFLSLRENTGPGENRTRDLFLGLWVPDLFMKRVEEGKNWSLFCPSDARELAESCGYEFECKYTELEARPGLARKVVKARDLWNKILASQIQTGLPYILFKDSCNSKSNQQNLGVIKCSNLCTEIVQYTSESEIAVCNLASLNLSKFVTPTREFDFVSLGKTVRFVTRALNRVIDRTEYPVPEAKTSNMRHRPIGIGVQGLADCFMKMEIAYESREAWNLNSAIFETTYFNALTESCAEAKMKGPCKSYAGSPASHGVLQFDMWADTQEGPGQERHDWIGLKAEIYRHGLRNSLLLAPMPTASTSQILGNFESFEPPSSNLFVRKTMSGEFVCANKHLIKHLEQRGQWTPEVRQALIDGQGSVQNIAGLAADTKAIFKTVWEVKGRAQIEMAADRGRFICQSQSFNVHLSDPTPSKLSSWLFSAWKAGLKTGSYYVRTRASNRALGPEVCTRDACTSCSS